MLGFGKIARSVFGTPNDRKIKATRPLVEQINALETEFEALSDEGLKDKTKALADRAKGGESLDAILPEAFANCREALGWDHDIMVHCHWEYDVRTAIQIAEAVAPIKPLWLEDAMIVNHSESWKRLTACSPVPICTGENLWRRHEFADFIVHQGCDILHPDLRNSGGFL